MFIRSYLIMAGANRNVLTILVAITMVVSLVGTMAAIAVLSGYGGYRQVPVSTGSLNEGSGKVSAYLEPAPVTGQVTVNLVSSEEGG
jgi:hypothetical protein